VVRISGESARLI